MEREYRTGDTNENLAGEHGLVKAVQKDARKVEQAIKDGWDLGTIHDHVVTLVDTVRALEGYVHRHRSRVE